MIELPDTLPRGLLRAALVTAGTCANWGGKLRHGAHMEADGLFNSALGASRSFLQKPNKEGC